VKTNKKNRLIVCLLGALFFALAGCSNILDSPEHAGISSQDGTGNVVIEINGGVSARTLVPDTGSITLYELTFSGTNGATHGTETITVGTSATVSLDAGNWTITAQAKAGETVRAQGSWTGTVSGNVVTSVSIPLTPSTGADGTFGYTISFPDLGNGGSSAKSLALYAVTANGTETAVTGTPVTNFTSGTPGSISLPAGFYRLSLTLTNSTGEVAGKIEALHIYAGLSTSAVWEFTEESFTDPAVPTTKLILTKEDLAKIGVDSGWTLAGSYVLGEDLTLDEWVPIGNVTWESSTNPVPDSSTPFTGNFDGGGHTITMNSFASTVTGNHYLGIFSVVTGSSATAKATVKNLNIVSTITNPVSLTNNSGVALGLVVGYTQFAEISNITLSGVLNTSSTRNAYIGGIVGYAQKGSLIKDSSSSMSINHGAGSGSGLASGMYYGLIGGFVGLFKDGADTTNCHGSGNVTVIGNASAGAAQAFVGGIAGGSYYQFTTESQGSISYCSNTGDVYCEVGGFWAWTGGIAGVVCGDGDGRFENITKVYRSWASGNVTAVGRAGQWPYTGGITGYIYYGGMVAECYFTGNVNSKGSPEGAAVNDYVGGISGYLSQNPTHRSTIRDCWSAGTVNGRLNAGGIVGQHQFYTSLSNCWSRAEITVSGLRGQIESAAQQGAGGIAGYSISGVSGNDTRLENCVALNPFINSPNGFERVGRVVGDNSGGEAYRSYGWSDMPVLTSGSPADPFVLKDNNGVPTRWSIDGTDCTAKPGVELYRDTLEWDFNTIWKMGGDGYPHLQWEE
jgi:hypothetical protein